MKTIYMDESGYTGYDLLNINQPFQAASSLMINEEQAKKLVEEYFPKRQGEELKHQKLKSSKSYWNSLLEVQKIMLDNFMGFTYICNKKYLLILRFLDDCVEPYYYNKGINFFKDGQNYALASLLYYTTGTFWGKNQFENLLYCYQRASKNKTLFNINFLVDQAKLLIGNELSEILIPLSTNEDCCLSGILKRDNTTDIVDVVILSLISHLEKFIDEKYEIIHDTSLKLLSYKKVFEDLTQILDKKSYQITDTTKVFFPLKLQSIEQKDSKASFSIQLADLLVGGAVEHYKAQNDLVAKNGYNQKVIESYNNINLLTMFPNIDFESTKKSKQNNQSYEFVDFIAQKLTEQGKKKSEA